MPVLADIGDSVRLADLLGRGADPQAHITSVVLRFRKDGDLRDVHVSHARSPSAGAEISDSIRPIVNPIGAHPRDFDISLVRLNATGQVRLLAATATCVPQAHLTPEAAAVLTKIRRDHSESWIYRRAVVEFIFDADGQVRGAWLSPGTNVTVVDSLLMELFRAMRFDPAIVGRTPTAALVQQPFDF